MFKFYQQILAFIFLAISLKGVSQDFEVTYDFSLVTASSGRTDPSPVPTAEGLTFGSFKAAGPSGNPSNNPNASGRFSFTGWPTGAINGSDSFSGSINTEWYYEVTITPQSNFTFSLQSVSFTLQRSGTGIRQYAVKSSIDGFVSNLQAVVDPANATLQVVPVDVFQVSDAATTAQEGSKIVPVAFSNVGSPLTLRFYGWNAEAANGTFSIDNVKLTGSASIAAGAPLLTLGSQSLAFPSTAIHTDSSPLTYTILGEHLSDPVTITVQPPFTVSDSINGAYANQLTLPPAAVAVPKTIYVKFSPVTPGFFTGTIVNSSQGANSKNIVVSAEGIDPANLVFNFDACSPAGTPGSGFKSYSVLGTAKWACSGFGQNNSKGVDMNGFSGSAQENEDWLISPALQIASLNLPVLRFYSRGEFTGPSLLLLISTNYDGSSNPNSAMWTGLPANFPPLSNVWTLSDGIDLSAYKAFSTVYLAFKYTSSPEFGAARWTLDNIDVSNRTTLLSVSPSAINFGEVAAGASSVAQTLSVKAIGYGDVAVTAPSGYEVSADNRVFTPSINLTATEAEAGSMVYIRFSPASKSLKTEGRVLIAATGLDSGYTLLTGSSYPKAETLDVGTYNLSFFGSNATNNPTPQKITTQINNIVTVFRHLNLDISGVEEVSSDSAIGILMAALPGYASVLSDRWSYSFNPPDPGFPPQKIGFIYNTATMRLVEQRVMFEKLFDSLRNGYKTLPGYPEESSHFWSSGRLPFMATFDATIGGFTKKIRFVVIHAKSSSDQASYNRRLYDIRLLKDSLDAYYPDDPLFIVGDYNDRVSGSINTGSPSPYKTFVDDTADYKALTLPLDQAGRVSFISGTRLIDHIIISDELKKEYIGNSTDIEDARTYISGYNASTASDHLPVYARFTLSTEVILPVKYAGFKAQKQNRSVMLTWTTSTEAGNDYFNVERSSDGINFMLITTIKGSGNTHWPVDYQAIDSMPFAGLNYYRLKQVDHNGTIYYSDIILVKMSSMKDKDLHIYPNPVGSVFRLDMPSNGEDFKARVTSSDGRLMIQTNGSINQINSQINKSLGSWKAGIYVLQFSGLQKNQSVTFIKQ